VENPDGLREMLEKKGMRSSAQGLVKKKAKFKGVASAPNRCPILLDDPFLGFLSGISVTVKYPDGSDELLTTDDDGMIKVRTDRGAYVDLKFETELRMHEMRVFVVLEDVSTPKGAWQRLVNMGYVDDPEPPPKPFSEDYLAAAVEEFQSEHGIRPTGELDSRTQSALDSSHDSTVPWREQRTALIDDDLDAEYDKDAVA